MKTGHNTLCTKCVGPETAYIPPLEELKVPDGKED